MIGRIRNALRLTHRRKEIAAELDAAYADALRLRPAKAFRQREWLRQTEALDNLRHSVVRATTIDEVDRKSKAIAQTIANCKLQLETEKRVAGILEGSLKKADELRLRAAKLQGTAFRLAERRHHAIKDECNHARRAKDSRTEEAALIHIEEKLHAFEAALTRAEKVMNALPVIEASIAAIQPQELWLDSGAKETYDDILATFAETQKDVQRGDYDKAAQRLREIETLEHNLKSRGARRAVWAVQEIAMWLTSPSVAAAFPQLAQFPTTGLTIADIENLYALRPEIEQFIADLAIRQRERNAPNRDISSGRKLAVRHPLRMPLEGCADPSELEEFLRCVTAFGR